MESNKSKHVQPFQIWSIYLNLRIPKRVSLTENINKDENKNKGD